MQAKQSRFNDTLYLSNPSGARLAILKLKRAALPSLKQSGLEWRFATDFQKKIIYSIPDTLSRRF
jgi:hypothetical protein